MIGPELGEVRPRLAQVFGSRLKGVVLFGSRARGDADPASDFDLLVLLDEPISLGSDLRRIVEALYPVQLQVSAPIHALPVSAEAFQEGRFGLVREARRDGIFL